MVAKKSKLHPLSKQFTVSEFEYLQRATKMISWPVDLQSCEIHIPQGSELSETEELTIRHLQSEYGFITVVSSNASKVNKLFDPLMKPITGIQKDIEEIIEEVKTIKVGTKFYDVRKNQEKHIFSETKSDWIVCIHNTMESNYNISKLSFQIGLDSGLWRLV